MPASIPPVLFPLMPWPAQAHGLHNPAWIAAGGIRLNTEQGLSERLRSAVQRLRGRLAQRLGTDAPGATQLPLTIQCLNDEDPWPTLGNDESYQLDISDHGIALTATEQWGVLHGLTTLTLLWQADATLPRCQIQDAPRFSWRGLMLDPARRFLPLPKLLATLDAMGLCKLNLLHLHLSDDQGFRFRSNRYPELASDDSYQGHELRQLVAHAADLGIRVVPELDVPGHCTSWLTAYPQWGSDTTQRTERFGVHKACLDPTNPEVRAAVATLLAELAEIFPDRYQHIGGDEVHPAWWTQNPRIQRYMQQRQLDTPADLQAEFTSELHNQVRHSGRVMVAWDEVLHPGFGPGAVVQNWRGATSRDRALAAGHDCVVSSGYYLDLMYPADVHYRFDPALPEAELLAQEDDMRRDLRFAHVAEGMAWTLHWRNRPSNGERTGQDQAVEPAPPAGVLLGAEACLWGELVDAGCLDVRLWSRMPALAERFWSSADQVDEADMYARLQAWQRLLPVLTGMDLTAQQRQGWRNAGIEEAWHEVCGLLEPVKWYARLLGEQALRARLTGTEMPQARPYQTSTRVNGWVDFLAPESLAAVALREFLLTAEPAALAGLAGHWQRLALRSPCPPPLQAMVANLLALSQLLTAYVAGELSQVAALAQAGPLLEPQGEVLLAVALPVVQWLQQQ